MKHARKLLVMLLVLAALITSVPALPAEAASDIKVGWVKSEESASSTRGSIKYNIWYYYILSDSKTYSNKLNDEWKKIKGKWYYFTSLQDHYGFSARGRMAENEWINGYWFSKDGTWSYTAKGSWKHNKNGWWYTDTNGWYAKNCWQIIDGYYYYFNAKGYMVTGWYKVGARWYYFKKDGKMANGHEYIKMDGLQYYFFGDGSWNSSKITN